MKILKTFVVPLILLNSTFLLHSCFKKINPNPGMVEEKSQKTKEKDTISAGPNVAWPAKSLPLKLKISEQFSVTEEELIVQMALNWEKSITLPENTFFNFSGDYSTKNYHYNKIDDYWDNELGIYPIQNWFEEIPPRTLGLTQYFGHRINKGTPSERIELVHADIFINTDHYVFTTDEKSQWSGYDLGTVVLHELGHLLGLGHGKEKPSVMGEYLSYLENPRFPTPIDQLKLKRNYSYLFQEFSPRKKIDDSASKMEPELIRGVFYLLEKP